MNSVVMSISYIQSMVWLKAAMLNLCISQTVSGQRETNNLKQKSVKIKS